MARIAVAACVGAGLVGVAATPGHADVVEADSAPPLRFLAYNICGSGGSSTWLCTGAMKDTTRGEVPLRVANVVRNVTDWSADAVFLNEVCRNQYDATNAVLAPRGYGGLFVPTMSANRCKDPRNGDSSPEEGLALFARGLRPLPDGGVYRLDRPGAAGEQFYLLCGDTFLQGRLARVCSTHWSAADAAINQYQAGQVKKIVDPWLDAGIPVVFGGDLNQHPFNVVMNDFYGMDHGTGRFTEVDESDSQYFQDSVGTIGDCENAGSTDRANCVPCPSSAARCRSGEPTYDVWKTPAEQPHLKPDYIFASREHFTDVVGDALPDAPYADATITDHLALRGAARWRASTPNMGHWTMDETSGTAADVSGLGQSAVMSGTTARGAGINGGRALLLTGTGIAKTTGPVLRTDQSFTVDSWVKLANKDNYQVAVSQDGANIGAFYLQYNKRSDRWVFNVPNIDSTGVTNWEGAASTSPPVIGEWTRLTGVYDAAAHQTRLYVNGTPQETVNGLTLWHGNGPLRIGGSLWAGNTTDWWSGTIDEVRVWQYARTESEIRNAPTGQWGFGEASGTAQDRSGNGRPAVMSGTTARGAGINGGRALQLTGTGIAKTTGPVLRTDQSFTVDSWVKLANKDNYQVAVSQDGANIGAFYLQYNKRSDRWVFNVPGIDSTSVTTWEGAVSTSPPVIGEWTRLTGVYDAAAHQTRLYVNGTPQETVNGLTLWHGNGPLRIGGSLWAGNTTDWWSGAIDEVRVWQYARTENEIATDPIRPY